MPGASALQKTTPLKTVGAAYLAAKKTTEISQFRLTSDNVIGASNFQMFVIGTDKASGRMYFWRSGSSLCQSDDFGATFSAARSLPASFQTSSGPAIAEFGGKVYLFGSDGTAFRVWSTPVVAQGSDWGTWTGPLLSLPSGSLGLSSIGLVASQWGSNDVLFCSTYGDPVGGPKIYRTTDGTTWTNPYARADARHVHMVAPDPYKPGNVWATIGDGANNCVLLSTDYGVTWNPVPSMTNLAYQGVQISFTATDVWIAQDVVRNNVIVVDRKTLTPKYGASNAIANTPPPLTGGLGARKLTDLVTTATSKVVTSATAAWTSDDKGRVIWTPGQQLVNGAYISSVDSATQVTLNLQALASGSALTGYVSGETYFGNAYFGAVDPATGIYYAAATDSSVSGQLYGMFFLTQPGGRLEIMDPGGRPSSLGVRAVVIFGGYVWCGCYRYKLLTLG